MTAELAASIAEGVIQFGLAVYVLLLGRGAFRPKDDSPSERKQRWEAWRHKWRRPLIAGGVFVMALAIAQTIRSLVPGAF